MAWMIAALVPACGCRTPTHGIADAGADGSPADVSLDVGADTSCPPRGGVVTLELVAPGVNDGDCLTPVRTEDASVVVLPARIVSAPPGDDLVAALDFCSPADASCMNRTGSLTLRGAPLAWFQSQQGLVPDTFVEIHWRSASPEGGGRCTHELEVWSLPSWDGAMPVTPGLDRRTLLLSAAHGVPSSMPSSLVTVGAEPVGAVSGDPPCPSGELYALRFAVAGQTPTRVEHARSGVAPVYGFDVYELFDVSSLVTPGAGPEAPSFEWVVTMTPAAE
ncbi:MAG: hypothetical protein U0234_10365 [Sandaracinus sp.]